MVNQEPYDPLEEIKKSMMAEEDAMNNNILTISKETKDEKQYHVYVST